MHKHLSFSISKVILAVLWQSGKLSQEKIKRHKYFIRLCSHRKAGSFRVSMMRLLDSSLVQSDAYRQYSISDSEQARNAGLNSYIQAEAILNSARNEEWDGGWRIVVFDIPESKKNHRERLRRTLVRAGFKLIQSSIWVYPFPVPNFLRRILADQSIKEHIKIITAASIESDKEMRKEFML